MGEPDMDWTFERAIDVIRQAGDVDESDRLKPIGGKAGLDHLLGAEVFILDQSPETAEQALAILDLAVANLAVGGRADGRDLCGLERVRGFLVSLGEREGMGRTPERDG
ncbi:hypothetical protein [Brevundimonas naejangsanensis]|uniref:hypothetical protein n=1 Tax=Brevundimonas naejangsanensis TaxID=588932 RepID=UPI00106CB81A|nr:hypothetical protein [Brevundimonas naejangsanensis]QBQ49945.1 hypothetical protein E3U41_15325 [Brevundimonas naejangsanensis]